MKTIIKKLEFDINFLNLNFIDIDINNTFFIDIETTGLSSRYNMIYLLGCIYYEKDHFKLIQWLCEKEEDEYEMLYIFSNFIKKYSCMIHYNGTSFDIPFIIKRLELYRIKNNLNSIHEIDIYRDIRSLHKIMPLENLKLKTVESYFGFVRKDKLDGSILIKHFKDYLKVKDNVKEKLILLHNEEDLISLIYCINAYKYINFYKQMKNKNLKINNLEFKSINNSLFITLKIDTHINLKINNENYDINIYKDKIVIKFSIYEGELLYFYENYKDYYYLPLENQVIHKSLAKFVDKKYKKKVSKENCYIKIRGTFIPLDFPIDQNIKFFKKSYKDGLKYFNLKDIQNNYENIKQICLNLLSSI